ncbi:hypothetical protein BHE90_016558 [Fusarium euwallaceae]|uniref:Uncharacterized protein n=1 Tax=Fusarium euwallaceae TaxID=1147111 RepID=A0A430L019_9HYPO|nr:hypothetical protein BHE90_016558 [Fusarium euwallaceae]
MDDAPEIALCKTDQCAVPEPVVVHVKSTATDMFGEKSLCFVTCHQNPSNVADSKCFGKACTVMLEKLHLHLDLPEQAIICTLCGYALATDDDRVGRHLGEKHHIPKVARQKLNALINSLQLPRPETLPKRADGSAPHPHLQIQEGKACRHCGLRSTSLTIISRHVKNLHKRELAATRSTGKHWLRDHIVDNLAFQSWTLKDIKRAWTITPPRASTRASRKSDERLLQPVPDCGQRLLWPGSLHNEADLLWAIKGAGSIFGIVVNVTFKTFAAPTYSVRNWMIPLRNGLEARLRLGDIAQLARKLAWNCSTDAYLFWDNEQLHLGVTMFESAVTQFPCGTPTLVHTVLGPEDNSKIVDGVGLFETEMYISGMHGGHGGGKTSSVKRCLFLKHIDAVNVAKSLVAAVETRPSQLCYLHLLPGGGAVGDVPNDATAFGCRDWDFACVVTGVWPRNQDGTETAQATVKWVYKVA